MFSSLTRRIAYNHLKMIHEHPNGIKNRFEQTGDKWIKNFNHPHIKNYYDFFENYETKRYDIELFETQKEEAQVKQIESKQHALYAQLKDYGKFFRPKHVDDNELDRDIERLTFVDWLKEGRQNFSSVHKLVAFSIGTVIVHVALYFMFYHGKEAPKAQRTKFLNAENSENYCFGNQQLHVQKIKETINILNDEFESQLLKSVQLSKVPPRSSNPSSSKSSSK